MHSKFLRLVLIFSLSTLSLVFSQEAGQYHRSSVSYIDALWLLDGSTRNLTSNQIQYILKSIESEISMPRFDFNPLPESIKQSFVGEANRSLREVGGSDEAALKAVTDVMNRTVVPQVLEIVNAEKEMRAAGMLTEQQRNSFITDKARELGITATELERVMNSAYIYIPVAREYQQYRRGDDYVESIKLGIIWWNIETGETGAEAKVVVSDFRTSRGSAKVGSNPLYRREIVDYRTFAFRAMADNGALNLKVATQEIPEFTLTGQVISRSGRGVQVNLGETEGLTVDDKYWILRNVEGKSEPVKDGWMIVRSVGDSASSAGYQSRGQVISGRPMLGAVVQEYPRLPFDVYFGYRYFNYSYNFEDDSKFRPGSGSIDSLVLDGGHGFEVGFAANIGRRAGISQLFFNFGYGMGFGGAEGTISTDSWNIFRGYRNEIVDLKSVMNYSFEFSLVKKFYMRRAALVLQPGFMLQTIAIDAGSFSTFPIGDTYYLQVKNEAIGAYGNVGLEFALSPAINIGGKFGYQFMPDSDDWEYRYKKGSGDWKNTPITSGDNEKISHGGAAFQIYVNWSPAALPFDPFAAFRQ